MKKLMILILALVCLFSAPAYAKQKPLETKKFHSMTAKTYKTGKRYLVKVYWKKEKIATYSFKKMPKVKFIKHDNLTCKKLTTRKNKILYIEILTGKQINKAGDGKIQTKDPYYNYISYKREGFQKGDKIRTYCIFNPYNNYEDDVIERYDEKIK